MSRNQKAAIYATVIVGAYGLTAYLMFSYAFSNILTTILTLPLSIAFIIGYGLGDAFGYLAIALMVLLIWWGCFVILRRRNRKASA